MRRHAAHLLIAVAAAATACAHSGQTGSTSGGGHADEGGQPEVVVGPAALAGGDVGLAAWLAYGIKKAALFQERPKTLHNRSADDYALELGAHAGMLDFWAERRAGGGGVPHLDLLLEIRSAGYLEEYVVLFFAKPGWTIPREALPAFDFRGFNRWAGKRLDGHEPPNAIVLKPKDAPQWPEIPGGKLPDPNELSPKQVPCNASADRLSAALAAWTKEEATLDGHPLGAQNRLDFARLIDWARDKPEYKARGITWVSPAVADLHFLHGFCAVEHHAFDVAEKALGESVRLHPLSTGARLELVHVMFQARRFDQADREIAKVLELTTNKCDLGHAWRKRGWMLVERGKLEDAYKAYQKSLEYDPSSRLALKEMLFIMDEARRLGGPQASAFKRYKPPPATKPNQVVTECREE